MTAGVSLSFWLGYIQKPLTTVWWHLTVSKTFPSSKISVNSNVFLKRSKRSSMLSMGFSHQIPELWCGYSFPLNAINFVIPLQWLSHSHHVTCCLCSLAASVEKYWPSEGCGLTHRADKTTVSRVCIQCGKRISQHLALSF